VITVRHFFFTITIAGALVACGGGGSNGSTTPGGGGGAGGGGGGGDGAESSDVTDFTLNDVDGNSVSLSQYAGKGKPVIISFWATWCKPCVAEMPHLQRLFDAKKAIVLAISLDGPETEAEVAPFVKSKGFTFPVLLDTETRAASLYNPRRAAPFTVIIDKVGKIVKRREGFNPGDEVQLEADIDAAGR
jgi:peroxiredoxin